MDKIFIRERINIVDYNNNNLGLVYSSADIDIEDNIINVTLESDVSGWHELRFDVPAFILKDGGLIDNPFLKKVFPLTKIQYTRVIKSGDKEEELILYFIVQPQEGTRDESGIVLQAFTCVDYPRHVLSKAKNGITIGEDTLDEKRSRTPNNQLLNVDGRVIYVKAPVQSREFKTYDEIGNWIDALPGAFAYDKKTQTGYRLTKKDPTVRETDGSWSNWYKLNANETYTVVDNIITPEPVWCPDWDGYPWMEDPNVYDYGALGIADIDESLVQFYWDTLWVNPDRTIGRYDGVLYRENSRLLYNIFKTFDYEEPKEFIGTYFKSENLDAINNAYVTGTIAYVLETMTVWRYNGASWENTFMSKREAFNAKEILKGEWSSLDPVMPYLTPNFAQPYLDYILEGTGWTVGEVDKIMVSNGTVEYDETGIVSPKEVELSTSLHFDNSNAYNAIYELCEAFKCYARFDHVNKTVSLKSIPGEDYGLTFQYRENLTTSRIHQDGEKAVSKLWVYGGEDVIGSVYIQDCNRMHPDYYLADYTSLEDLKKRVSKPEFNNYAKVSTSYSWAELSSQTLKDGKRLPIANTFLAGELAVSSWGAGSIPIIESSDQLPDSGSLGQMYYIEDENSYWAWFPEGNTWYDTFLDLEPSDKTYEVKFQQRYDYTGTEWVDKGQFYHWYEPVSPYADNYIMDFRYFTDRGLMTHEQVEDVKFNYVLPISRLNRKRWPLYTQYQNLSSELNILNDTYDSCKIARDAIDKAIRTNYAIYEKKDGKSVLKELNVSAYPPGANLNTTGWVKAKVAYSDATAPEVDTYADIATKYPAPEFGDFVKIKDEATVYYWSNTYSFEDTICSYLGWDEGQVANTQDAADSRKKTLLFSPDGTIEARVRNEGLFQKLRDEELFALLPEQLGELGKGGRQYWRNPMSNIHGMPMDYLSENSTAHSYYDGQDRFITEQINMNDALDQIGRVETEMTLLLQKIEVLELKIKEIDHALVEKYGDYIVEGVFTDDTMVWIYNLWYAGLKALELYHRPLITYEFGVLDISGLPEYRTNTPDIYHDIVYRMNKPELVLPNPGDYCYVTDNKLGVVREKANITAITRNLSNPSQNQVTIATVDTNTEDLIGKLVTAANTLYSKEQIYNRSAVIKSDGTIAEDNIVKTLDNNSGNISILSNSGTVMFGENGITTTDREDAQLRMQYTGKGIFSSTNGGTTWENIVNAGKISIKSLSAGTIDSNSISVSNIGHDSSIIIDGKGITALNYGGSTSAPDLSPAIVDKKHCSFFLDAKTGDAYFKGYLEAGAGLIGGWDIAPDKLSKGGTGMSSTGTYAFWAGDKDSSKADFSVKHDGTLKATKANIEGTINAKDGKIGGFTLTDTKLYSGSGNTTAGNGVFGHEMAFWAGNEVSENAPFRVGHDGSLVASNANISGHITATSGSFTGAIYASSGTFTGAVKTGSTITGSTISGGSINIQKWGYGKKYYFDMGVSTNHPNCSGLNVGTGGVNINKLGISSDTKTFTISGGIITPYLTVSHVSTLNGDTTVYGTFKTNRIRPDSSLLITTGGASGTAGASSFYVASNNNITFKAVSSVYASGNGLANSRVKTDNGSASSRSTKKNFSKFTQDTYAKSLSLLKDIDIYKYDYKYDLYQKREQYGFIIDDVEKLKDNELFFDFKTSQAKVDGEHIDFEVDEERDKNCKKITVKQYDSDVLDKYMLTCIKALQMELEELKNK